MLHRWTQRITALGMIAGVVWIAWAISANDEPGSAYGVLLAVVSFVVYVFDRIFE